MLTQNQKLLAGPQRTFNSEMRDVTVERESVLAPKSDTVTDVSHFLVCVTAGARSLAFVCPSFLSYKMEISPILSILWSYTDTEIIKNKKNTQN